MPFYKVSNNGTITLNHPFVHLIRKVFMLTQEVVETTVSTVQLFGAGCFGAIIGWYVYFINRHRKGEVSFSDLSTVIGIIGGAAVLTLFPTQTELFGAYGIGLAVGFFGYYIMLLIMVGISPNFDTDWFLDGRRKDLADGYVTETTLRRKTPGRGFETVAPEDRTHAMPDNAPRTEEKD
jgi:hypothetical protein